MRPEYLPAYYVWEAVKHEHDETGSRVWLLAIGNKNYYYVININKYYEILSKEAKIHCQADRMVV